MQDRQTNVPTVSANDRGTNNEWPTLLGRMVDDLSRIVETELRLFEANLVGLLNTTVDRAIAGMLLLALSVVGGACLLVALILLLHQWLPLWEAIGIVGLAIEVIGAIAFLSIRAPKTAS